MNIENLKEKINKDTTRKNIIKLKIEKLLDNKDKEIEDYMDEYFSSSQLVSRTSKIKELNDEYDKYIKILEKELEELEESIKDGEKSLKKLEVVETKEINIDKGKEIALREYENSGYGVNAYGHYFNIWIDEYDADYKPWEDEMFNPYLREKEEKTVKNLYEHFTDYELIKLLESLNKRAKDDWYYIAHKENGMEYNDINVLDQIRLIEEEVKRRGIIKEKTALNKNVDSKEESKEEISPIKEEDINNFEDITENVDTLDISDDISATDIEYERQGRRLLFDSKVDLLKYVYNEVECKIKNVNFKKVYLGAKNVIENGKTKLYHFLGKESNELKVLQSSENNDNVEVSEGEYILDSDLRKAAKKFRRNHLFKRFIIKPTGETYKLYKNGFKLFKNALNTTESINIDENGATIHTKDEIETDLGTSNIRHRINALYRFRDEVIYNFTKLFKYTGISYIPSDYEEAEIDEKIR